MNAEQCVADGAILERLNVPTGKRAIEACIEHARSDPRFGPDGYTLSERGMEAMLALVARAELAEADSEKYCNLALDHQARAIMAEKRVAELEAALRAIDDGSTTTLLAYCQSRGYEPKRDTGDTSPDDWNSSLHWHAAHAALADHAGDADDAAGKDGG